MNILVIGNGGREHAICWKLSGEKGVNKVYAAPGNAGISEICECIDIGVEDTDGLLNFSIENSIDLVVVGPELPLVNGIVDEFEKKGIGVFGPNKSCSRLEGSKFFSKQFMVRHNIPAAKYCEYTDVEDAKKGIDQFGYPVVIKADGLAAGKGVVIAESREEAIEALNSIMVEKKFGNSGDLVVLEEFLEGIETSILALVDKNSIVAMESAKDHKKIFNYETGPNTGGMGTFSPSTIYTDEIKSIVTKDILERSLEGFKKDGLDYRGVLFVGLMITKDGIKVLEYNCRFGDPEIQSILMRLESDLSQIMLAVIEDRLDEIEIRYTDESACTVILASGGYPESYEKGRVISGLDDLEDGVVVFHSGTRNDGNNVVTAGGRVLGISSRGKSVKDAANKVYRNIEKIYFEGMQYRTDIGV